MMDSARIYRSHRDAAMMLTPLDRLAFYEAILNYALDDKEPDIEGEALMLFTAIRPTLDIRNEKAEAGKRGGRPSKKTNGFDNQKPMVSEDENHRLAKSKSYTDTDTETDTDTDTDSDTEADTEKPAAKPQKHRYGAYKHVLLTDDELAALIYDFGEAETNAAIKFLDEYIAEKGYKSKSHNLAIRRWVFDAVRRQTAKAEGAYKSTLPDWSQF